MLIEQSGLFTTDSLSMIDAVEDWTSKDRKDTVLKLSFKVCSSLPWSDDKYLFDATEHRMKTILLLDSN